jgi:tripeptidyl-peptidase-1
METDLRLRVPEGWSNVGKADPETLITLTIALKQRNLAQLEALLMAVSDPKSSQYGMAVF